MNENQPVPVRRGFLELLHSPVTAWTILLISTLLTALGWWVSRSYVAQRAQERFDYEVDRAEQLILRRMRVFERMMVGARGLHYASEVATRAAWRDYVTALSLPEYYPGVQGLGFVRWVTAEERPAYEAGVRAEGFPNFAITPPGERAEYACVTYIEPFEQRNLRAFGYDLWSEPVRRAGLSQARDTGKPALTGKMFLVQETGTNVQPGVIMLVPMYRAGQPVTTVAERRAALFGWVHAPFRIGDLLHGILGNADPEIGFDLFDGEQPVADAHLFNSDAELAPMPAAYQPSRTETRQIKLAGHPWLLRFHTRPEFEAATDSNQPFLIAFGGLAIDGLLFAIIWSLAGLRRRAERLAEVLTVNYRRANEALGDKVIEHERADAALRASEERFQAFMNQSPVVAWVKDEEFRFRYVNSAFEQLFNRPAEQILGRTDYDLYSKETADVTRANDRQVLASGVVTEAIEPVPGADGRMRRWLVHKFPLQQIGQQLWVGGTASDVTARLDAEEAARESGERFRLLFEGANDAIFWAAAETGLLTHCNAAAETLLGRERAEIIGQPQSFLHPPEEAERCRELFRAHASSQSKAPFELEVLRKDGQRVPVSISPSVTVVDGKPLIQGIFRDITGRKQAEARLTAFLELGQQLSAAQTVQEAGEIIVETADRLIGWDSCGVNLYSEADDSLQCVLLKDILHGQRQSVPAPTDDRKPTARVRRVFAHGAELILREPSGSVTTDGVMFGDTARPSLSLMNVPVRSGSRGIGVLSIQSYQAHAYTPQDLELLQVLAGHCGGALARIQAALALRTSEERFRLVWENTVDGLRLADGEGRVVAANAAFCRLMGRPRAEVEGQLFSDLYAEGDQARILARHRERFTQDKVPTHLQRQLTLWDGRKLWLEVSNCFVETDPACPLLLSSFRDITPSRSLEEQLRQSQKMEAVGQLAGGIAHDFNNILGAIIGNVELARTMPPEDQELKVSHDAIFDASRRAADLVKQILAFSRRQEQQRQTLQLGLVVREAVQLLRATVPAGVEFEKHLPTVPTVLADASAIHQVAMNLCTNAWHALKGQPGLIRVELAEATVTADFARLHPDLRPGRHVRLSVTDNGCGMAPATQARIFEPFFTTKPVGEGTGLGLPVVHGIMKNHEGGILVASAPGQGTTVELYFPVFEAEAIETAAALGPVPQGAGEHILFVDDEAPMAKLARSVLSRLGYRVTVFANPAAAVAAFRAQPEQFDLVITDYNMPGMNGTSLGAQILSIRPSQRILLTTGYSADVSEAVARSLGFRELLPKPYDLRAIGEAVRRVLHASQTNS